MSNDQSKKNERERFLFLKAFPDIVSKNVPDTNEYHPLQDINFLVRLDADQITEEERTVFLNHLADCPCCRDEIASFIRTGIVFEDLESDRTREDLSLPQSKAKKRSAGGRRSRLIILAASAVVLFVLFGGFLIRSIKPDPVMIARKNLELVLTQEDLEYPQCLVDFGYSLSGNRMFKSIEDEDPHVQQVRSAYEKVLEMDPEDEATRLSYSHYLFLIARDPVAARTVLEPLCLSEKSNPEADLLNGMIAFEQADDQKAIDCFGSVLKKDPDHFQARLNLGITLHRSGRVPEAIEQFKRILENPLAKDYYRQIDLYLEKQNKKKSETPLSK